MRTNRLLIAASMVLLTLAGYFLFPGHTFLHQDTQIYIPILERYWNPALFSEDLIAQRPHVSFTVYDEAALGLRRIAGLDFEAALTVQQLVLRALGIAGVFLIATSLGVSRWMAMLVAAIFSLGATIAGPAVLTVEYEPVPRGFAVPLLLLAVGFVAHGRDLAAGIAASAAFLYHAPTTWPFWIIYFALALWPTRPAIMTRHILGLMPLLFAVVVMLFLSRLQTGITEPQPFFGQIPPEIEKLQRMRASYNYVSTWPTYWYLHYVFLWVVSLAAFLRLRKLVSGDLKFFLVGMPLIGVISIPLSYLLLEKLKSVLIPQIQPARAVLFTAVLAVILASVAGVKAAQSRRWLEAMLWLFVGFGLAAHTRLLDLLRPADATAVRRLAVVLILSAIVVAAAWAEAERRKWRIPAWAAAAALPFVLIPTAGKVSNYPHLDSRALAELAEWARTSTPKDAVFLFPDAGRQLYPGIFRANSLRAIYVDWKGGGQVNFFYRLGEEWWERWQQTMGGKFDPTNLDEYAKSGIGYAVVRKSNAVRERTPVFENSEFVVYRVRPDSAPTAAPAGTLRLPAEPAPTPALRAALR